MSIDKSWQAQNSLLLGHLDLVRENITILQLILEEGLLDLQALNHAGLDLLVQLDRRTRWPGHPFANVREERADFIAFVDKDLALTGQGLSCKVKVLEEDHDGWVAGIGMKSLEPGKIGIEVEVESEIICSCRHVIADTVHR